MNKKMMIIASIVLTLLVIVAIVVVLYAAGVDLPILPDNGNGNGGIGIITVTSPKTGYVVSPYGPWYNIAVAGTISDMSEVTDIVVCWHDNIDYSRMTFTASSSWSTKMVIERLSTGSHTLRAKAMNGNTVVDETSISIVIPDSYIYVHDSDNPEGCSNCNAVYPDGQGGYNYNFKMPYEQDPGWEGTGWRYLKGEVTRVVGEVSVYHSDPNQLDLFIRNKNLQTQWQVVKRLYEVGTGWVSVDITLNNIWADKLCFSGRNPGLDKNQVDGFKGKVYVVPGTRFYQSDIFSIIMDFLQADQENYIPSLK